MVKRAGRIDDAERLVNEAVEREYQGGELNSRPRAYESPALPLSYPGVARRRNVPKARNRFKRRNAASELLRPGVRTRLIQSGLRVVNGSFQEIASEVLELAVAGETAPCAFVGEVGLALKNNI